MTESGPPWRRTGDGVIVSCRLTPKGGRDAIEGVAHSADGTSVVTARVRCAPEKGEANAALCALLAEALDAPASQARIVSGKKGRVKQVSVAGDPALLIARLEALAGHCADKEKGLRCAPAGFARVPVRRVG